MKVRRPAPSRRSLLRALPALAGAVLAAAGTAPAQAADPEAIEPLGALAGTLVAAADGTMWVTGKGPAVRVTRDGRPQPLDEALSPYADLLSPVTSLADGTVAFVRAAVAGEASPAAARLVRTRGGRAVARVVLPNAVADAPPALIAPDGAVWSARSCDDGLTRVAPGGRAQRFRLRRVGCAHVDEWEQPEKGQTLLRGADGALWLANQCQGRVARVDLRGRLREWRVRPACREDENRVVVPTPAFAEPDGALRLPGVRIDARGVVRASARFAVPDVVTPDGGEWTVVDGGTAVLRRANGAAGRIGLGDASGARYAWAVTAGADGRLWFVGGAHPYDRTKRSLSSLADDAVFGAVSAAGAVTTWRLPAWPRGIDGAFGVPVVAAGPDGRAWIPQDGPRPDGWVERLVRVTAGTVAAGPPRATVRRTLTRVGSRLWLQVACDAPPGRFCNGRVGLADGAGRRLATAPARFAIAGGAREAVAVRLDARALRLTRQRGIAARAQVRGAVRPTTKRVRVPR